MINLWHKFSKSLIGIFAIIGTILLVRIFQGLIILPQSFTVFSFELHYYGLILAIAIAVGYALAMSRKSLYQILPAEADKLIFIIIISGYIGARFYHVFSDWHFYLQNPMLVFAVWRGGLSIIGAILGGFLGLLVFSYSTGNWKRAQLFLDWLAPSVIVGQIIGRFGNLFNYEAYGYPTSLPWKMFIPFKFREVTLQSFSYFHPVFLYEAIGNLIIFIIIFRFAKTPKKQGTVFFLWLVLYNGLRFVIEHFRTDSTFLLQGIRLNAVVSLLLLISAAICLYRNTKLKLMIV